MLALDALVEPMNFIHADKPEVGSKLNVGMVCTMYKVQIQMQVANEVEDHHSKLP